MWVKAPCNCSEHQESCGAGAGPALGGVGRNHVPAHPHTGLGPPALQRGSLWESPFGWKAPHSEREDQRLQKLCFPDSCSGLRAHSWLRDSVSKKHSLWQPWLPEREGPPRPGDWRLSCQKEEGITLPANEYTIIQNETPFRMPSTGPGSREVSHKCLFPLLPSPTFPWTNSPHSNSSSDCNLLCALRHT